MALQPLIPDPNQGGLPTLDSMPMPSPTPSLPPTLKPLVTNPRIQQEQSLQDKISSYENPAAPQGGFWHKLGHVAAQIGNVAGDLVAAPEMKLIPGTDLNKKAQHTSNVAELAGLQGQDRQDATEASENTMRSAQTENTQAKTAETEQETAEAPEESAVKIALQNAQMANLLHPQAKTDFEAWQQQNPGKPIHDWLQLQSQTKPGNDFEQYYKDYITDNNLPDSAHNRLMARKEFAAAGQAPQRAPQVTIINPQGQVQSLHAGDTVAPGSMSASQFGAGNAADLKASKAQTTAANNMDNELDLMKQFAAAPSPTNDVAMLMHYIGATKPEAMGKIRLNENEIKLFGGTRSSLGDASALISKVANGQSLTPEQRTDMVNTMTMINQAARRGGGGAAAAGGGTQTFTEGGVTYHIPAEHVADFKKDHPNAR